MTAIKLAFDATVITMIFIGILAMLINLIKEKDFCVVCGDPSIGDFCCEAHENLHYDEEELSREEDEDDEQGEIERQERIGKALPFFRSQDEVDQFCIDQLNKYKN